jgi:hypothetical protein
MTDVLVKLNGLAAYLPGLSVLGRIDNSPGSWPFCKQPVTALWAVGGFWFPSAAASFVLSGFAGSYDKQTKVVKQVNGSVANISLFIVLHGPEADF